MIEFIKSLFGHTPSPNLKTHTIIAEIHAGDTGDWVLFFYDAHSVKVLEKTGLARSKVKAVKCTVAARNKYQREFKRVEL